VERLAAVLITPSFRVPNWSVIYIINTAPSPSQLYMTAFMRPAPQWPAPHMRLVGVCIFHYSCHRIYNKTLTTLISMLWLCVGKNRS
jgi:hypothetical protein